MNNSSAILPIAVLGRIQNKPQICPPVSQYSFKCAGILLRLSVTNIRLDSSIIEDQTNNLTVYIYTDDHQPAHVHIFKDRKTDTNKADIKIYIGSETEPPKLIKAYRSIKDQDIVKAMQLVADNQEMLLEKWQQIHGTSMEKGV